MEVETNTQNEVIEEPQTEILMLDELEFDSSETRKRQCMRYYTKGMRQSFQIGNVVFPNRLLNAAGCICTTQDELMGLVHSKSGGIVTKSTTLYPRYGNKKPRYYETDSLSINSTGLANNGYKFYSKFAEHVKKCTTKPYIVSVAGIKNGDNLKILEDIQNNDNIDFIELNLSCPNIIGKPQIGYDFTATEELLSKVYEQRTPVSVPLGLKLPPYFDLVHFQNMVEIISEYNISFITCINSIGNGFVFTDDFKPSILPNSGFGGIGGSIIKPIGLSNVKRFKELMPYMTVIGCGGISTVRDVCEYLAVGASLVQIGTQLIKTGPRLFEDFLLFK